MDDKIKNLAILGSTGSIGTQTLMVVDEHPEMFNVEILTANDNADLLIEQAIRYEPSSVIIANELHYSKVADALEEYDIKVFAGSTSIADIVTSDAIDVVVVALVGYSGLIPTINAIKAEKTIALANKETMVVAGQLINDLLDIYEATILPIDSEHSAILQCLTGEKSFIDRILLTASGGPFIGKDQNFLQNVTPQQALKHPNWDMGAKITIDSASLMNKGFEMIEAKWLFGVPMDKIDVLIHPQSIIHSMVSFIDGSVKAQLGIPDMRIPIQYALTYPYRKPLNCSKLSLKDMAKLSFEEPDKKSFRNLQLAIDAMDRGGNMPCVLNAANEIAVEGFLNERINFLQMSDLIEEVLGKVKFIETPGLDDYIDTNYIARIRALEYINKLT